MPSIHAISTHAVSSIDDIPVNQALLELISQARISNITVFLEVEAREQTTTQQKEVIPSKPGSGLRPVSAMPVSSLNFARSTRQSKTFLFSTRPWRGRPTDAFRPNVHAHPRLISGGRISRSIPVDIDDLRRGQRTIGDAQIANPDREFDKLFKVFSVQQQSVRCYVGLPESNSQDWVLLYEARIESIESTRQIIRFNITNVSNELKRPLQLRRFTGKGGRDGDSFVAGTKKPICYGDAYCIEPRLINRAKGTYCVNDDRIANVDWVREGALDYTYTTNYATTELLELATIQPGEYAQCREEGTFRIGTNLEGLVYPIRCAVKGDASATGYTSQTGHILHRVARNRAFLGASQVNLSSFLALPSGAVSYWYDGTNEELSCEDIFNTMLVGVYGFFGAGRGEVLSVGRIVAPGSINPDLNATEDQALDYGIELRPDLPRLVQNFTYAPTWNPLTEDQVSPAANPTDSERMTQNNILDSEQVSSDLAATATDLPTLPTLFSNRDPALNIARNVLAIVSENRLPARIDLGRIGLIADLAKHIGYDSDRVTEDFVGVVYEQDDDIGPTIRSTVLALG